MCWEPLHAKNPLISPKKLLIQHDWPPAKTRPSRVATAKLACSTSWAHGFGSPLHGHTARLPSSAGCSMNDRHRDNIPHSVPLMDRWMGSFLKATGLSATRSVALHGVHAETACCGFVVWIAPGQWTSPQLALVVWTAASAVLREELHDRDDSCLPTSVELRTATGGLWHPQ